MKKNVLIFCLLGFVIAASAKVNPKGYYNMRLIGVDVSDGTKGEFRTERTRYGIDFSTYLDDEIEISLTVHPTRVSFELMNKTDEAINGLSRKCGSHALRSIHVNSSKNFLKRLMSSAVTHLYPLEMNGTNRTEKLSLVTPMVLRKWESR